MKKCVLFLASLFLCIIVVFALRPATRVQSQVAQSVYLPIVLKPAAATATATRTPTATATATATTTPSNTPSGNLNPNPPSPPVKLVFVHHSTGGYWLADNWGGLGIALKNNNYYVSATNYGWGPNSIGDATDIGHWYNWFGGGRSTDVLDALYTETGQNFGGFGSYTRLSTDPGGENEIVMFKSCFPNSNLRSPSAPIPAIDVNPLRGLDSGSSYHTVANAKGIYIDLLNYFATKQNKLFIVIAAPPLSDGTYAANARAFNNWLVNDWLSSYPYNNVAVFDFYDVLTTNGGNANTNDLGSTSGNHHRYRNGAIEHITNQGGNTLAYPTGDDHPSAAGDLKATGEFVPLLNIFYHRWKGN